MAKGQTILDSILEAQMEATAKIQMAVTKISEASEAQRYVNALLERVAREERQMARQTRGR